MPLILIFRLLETVPFSRAGCINRASGASGGGGVGSARRAVRQRLPAAGLVARKAAAGLGTWRAVWGRGRAAGLGTRRAVRGLRACGARKRPRLGRSGADVRWPAYGGRRRLSSGPRPSKSRRPAGRCGAAARWAADSGWLVALRACAWPLAHVRLVRPSGWTVGVGRQQHAAGSRPQWLGRHVAYSELRFLDVAPGGA